MKKITVWLTATAAAIALVVAYQLNVPGVGGKEGDGGDRPQAPAAATAPADPSATSSTAPKSDSDGANSDHTGKPGENK